MGAFDKPINETLAGQYHAANARKIPDVVFEGIIIADDSCAMGSASITTARWDNLIYDFEKIHLDVKYRVEFYKIEDNEVV